MTVLFDWELSNLSYVDPKDVGPGFITASEETSDLKGIIGKIVDHVKTTDLLINDEHDAKLLCDVYIATHHSRVVDLGTNLSYLLEINNRRGSQRLSVRVTEKTINTKLKYDDYKESLAQEQALKKLGDFYRSL